MAKINPFKGIRPVADKVHLVASRSVDGYNSYELKEKLAGNPYTFLHIINPDFDDGKKTKPGSLERLTKIKRKFQSYIKEHVFIQEEKPSYYIYRQIKEDHIYTGIIACISIDDYFDGVIKIHEQTITQREEKLKSYLDVCQFNAEPVLFCYPNNSGIDELTAKITQTTPTYDFTTTDKVRHTLWVVNDDKQVEKIQSSFRKIPHIYIADGHHRSASSALLGKSRRNKSKNYTGEEAFNFYLGVFFPETEMQIYDYNRVVKDLGDLTPDSLVAALSKNFTVEKLKQTDYSPKKDHEISMYISGSWYSLTPHKNIFDSKDPVDSLDAAILTNKILDPLFDIKDLKTDKRIGFVPGIKGNKELKKLVDEGRCAVAFGLYPVTMEHLKWIADTNNIMPPKSTWVEPKMRSGLVIYTFD